MGRPPSADDAVRCGRPPKKTDAWVLGNSSGAQAQADQHGRRALLQLEVRCGLKALLSTHGPKGGPPTLIIIQQLPNCRPPNTNNSPRHTDHVNDDVRMVAAAADGTRAIGRGGQLPWDLPEVIFLRGLDGTGWVGSV